MTRMVEDPVNKERLFYGYVLHNAGGRTTKREMVWQETGVCVSTNVEADRIVWKA